MSNYKASDNISNGIQSEKSEWNEKVIEKKEKKVLEKTTESSIKVLIKTTMASKETSLYTVKKHNIPLMAFNINTDTNAIND